MMKRIIAAVMLLSLVSTALGTMWLYDDPMFFQVGAKTQTTSFKPANFSPIEIINAPYFPLLGEGFYKSAIPVQISNSTDTIQIGSSSKTTFAPVTVTFGGHLENNLNYAMSKSSLRLGQQGSWNTLNVPGAR